MDVRTAGTIAALGVVGAAGLAGWTLQESASDAAAARDPEPAPGDWPAALARDGAGLGPILLAGGGAFSVGGAGALLTSFGPRRMPFLAGLVVGGAGAAFAIGGLASAGRNMMTDRLG